MTHSSSKMAAAARPAAAPRSVLISCSKDREREDELRPASGRLDDPDEHAISTAGPRWPTAATAAAAATAQTLQGGEDGRSCYDCHAYLHTHGDARALRKRTRRWSPFDDQWHIQNCAVCHGADYAGGRAGVSCRAVPYRRRRPGRVRRLPQPAADRGDQAALWHGTRRRRRARRARPLRLPRMPRPGRRSDARRPAARRSAVLARDSGQHRRRHQPDALYAHLARPTSGNGACSNIYCHSDGRRARSRAASARRWPCRSGSAARLACGGCHRTPPPLPHQQVTTCGDCHTNVDPASDNALPVADPLP